MVKELEPLSSEENLRKLRLFSLEKAWGDLNNQSYLYSIMEHKGGCKEDSLFFFSGAQCQDKKQWALTATQEILSKHQEALFLYVGDRALTQVVQRCCGIFSLENFKSHLNMVLKNLLWVNQLE